MSDEIEECPIDCSCYECGDRQVCEVYYTVLLGFSEEEVNGWYQ